MEELINEISLHIRTEFCCCSPLLPPSEVAKRMEKYLLDKLSSVFELKVKEGNRSQFNRDININMAGFNMYLDGPLPGNGGLVLSVRRGIFELFTKIMDRPVEPRYWDALAKASWDLNQTHRISVIGFYYKDDAERREKMEDHGMMARKYEYSNWNDYGSAAGVNWRALFHLRKH